MEKFFNIKKLQQNLNQIKIGDSNGELLKETNALDKETTQAITKLQYIVKKDPTGEINEEILSTIKRILDKPVLKTGINESSIIRYLQWRLGVYIDGVFGNQTRIAVMKFQELNNISIDGVVSDKTWDILI